ncbi:tRNA (N6-threonylcarbamoyladenosine(37)-N6)-methyltransferase TrmO [Algibacillus agarilyticus]|uniref:tRNA (N6-threonylcarbamoyladenosine(37)-N6)-methyltransferase TrmO n=1 Tax=Algibacillus agarilyticus TaxID=2234133 RepID=UPI000DD01F1E|nr:tRNA (N6-threonylcarbamoyladenosine(37)-N6)-methyltransferase TrmO [Algibacillus agarilyticus]
MDSKPRYEFNSIGYVQSLYKEKFAVPRQPNIITQAQCQIILSPEFANEDSIKGLADFSHIWVQFVFNQNEPGKWHYLVRPPRLGGNKKIGVYASRSPFRPNPIGLSAVEYLGHSIINNQIVLNIKGGDFVNGTPVIDIKPYIKYVDCIPKASSGFAQAEPQSTIAGVTYTELAQRQKNKIDKPIIDFIEAVLMQDPRPAYKKNKLDTKVYSVKIGDFDVRFEVIKDVVKIREFEKADLS